MKKNQRRGADRRVGPCDRREGSRRRGWRSADHPIWKVAQSVVGVIGLTILVTHGVDGGHQSTGLDREDLAGAVGMVAAGNVARQLLKGLST